MMHHQNWFNENSQEVYKNGCQGFGHKGMYYHSGGWMFMMAIGLIILVGAIFFGIAYFRSKNKQTEWQHTNPSGESSTAIDILDKEFASGNITEEEYLRKKELLNK